MRQIGTQKICWHINRPRMTILYRIRFRKKGFLIAYTWKRIKRPHMKRATWAHGDLLWIYAENCFKLWLGDLSPIEIQILETFQISQFWKWNRKTNQNKELSFYFSGKLTPSLVAFEESYVPENDPLSRMWQFDRLSSIRFLQVLATMCKTE